MKNKVKPYTKQEDETLLQMTKEGYTARAIAKKLGRSKGSVLGRRHRLQFKDEPKIKKNKTAALTNVFKVPEYPSTGQCIFPIGDVGTLDFHFCGKPQHNGQVYCNECCSIAYEKWGKRNVKCHTVQTETYW